MKIKHNENAHKGSFFIEEEGNSIILAELTYSFAGADKMILDRTIISEALKDTGTERLLLDAAISYSRIKNIKVVPLCQSAKALIDNNPEYRKILLT